MPRGIGWQLCKGAAPTRSRGLPRGGVPQQPHSEDDPTCFGAWHRPLLPGPPYLVMAQSEVRGGDPGSPTRISVREMRTCLEPAESRPKENWSDRPPHGGVTIRSLEREPGPPLGRALRGYQLHLRSGARPRLPRDGEKRQKVVPLAKRLEPLGSFPLHHRGELGAFSLVSGPPCLSLRPRQRRDWRWRPSKMPVLVSTVQRRERRDPPRDRHSPLWHARAPEPPRTVVCPRS